MSFIKSVLPVSKDYQASAYEKMLSLVLALFFFCSLEPITLLSDLGVSRFFVLGRYISYVCLFALGLWNCLGREKRSIRASVEYLFSFLRDHVLFLFVGICALFVCIQASVIEPLIILVVITACWKCPFPYILRTVFITDVIFFLMIIGLEKTGFLQNLVFVRDGDVRQSLGFIYPLELQTFLFFMSLSWFCLRNNRYSWISVVVIAVINFWFYRMTKARFSTMLILLSCIFFLIYRYRAKLKIIIFRRKPIRKEKRMKREQMMSWIHTHFAWIMLFTWLAMVTILYLAITEQFLYSFRMRPIYRVLDRIFNNRLVLGRGAYWDYGFHAFGRTIEWIGLGGVKGETAVAAVGKLYNYVDVSYYKNLFDYGYVWMFFVLFFYGWAWVKAWFRKDYVLYISILVILLGGVFEPRLVQISMNPFLLLAGPLLFTPTEWFIETYRKIAGRFQRTVLS